jgi:signal transduction histidine kinase
MRERAERLGGTFKIKSETGVGTIVVVRLPYGKMT